MLASLVAAVPDAYIGEDGVWRITFEIEAGQLEQAYLAHQILLQDMFITTASAQALSRHGEQYQFLQKIGTISVGTLTFEGEGGAFIPLGTEAAYDPGGGVSPIFFVSTVSGTIPNPGSPTGATATNSGAGSLPAGTYEYAVTFVTASGETSIDDSDPSNTLIIPINRTITVTAIPTGGPGTIARRIYRRVDGGAWGRLAGADAALNNIVTTSITDGGLAATSLPPTVDTAHKITVAAASLDVGAEANAAIGTVTVLTSAPSEIVGVTNPVAFTAGSDPEDTEEYRQRLLQFVRSPGTGSPDDLQVLAESINGVESATVFENVPTNGTTTIRIAGPGGTIPGAPVIAEVQAAMDAYDIANMTIVVDVFIATVQAVTADVTLEGSFTLGDVTPSVQTAVTDYINSLDVGETLYVAGLIDAVFGLAGVADVVITVPAANVTTTSDHKITPGVITVS